MPKIELTIEEKSQLERAVANYLIVIDKLRKKAESEGQLKATTALESSLKSLSELQNKLL